jgi:hypothetical protein
MSRYVKLQISLETTVFSKQSPIYVELQADQFNIIEFVSRLERVQEAF